MPAAFHTQLHRRGEQLHVSVESALLNAGALIVTIATLLILALGVFAVRAL